MSLLMSATEVDGRVLVARKRVGARLGDLELLAVLGVGTTCEFFLARPTSTPDGTGYVAVKWLIEWLAGEREILESFLEEARRGATLDHAHILRTQEYGCEDGRPFTVMEYLAGMSLAYIAGKLERTAGGRMPVPLVLGLAVQACSALHHLHEPRNHGAAQGFVHHAVSARSLVVTFDGVIKLVELGATPHVRGRGSCRAPCAFLEPVSPEQARGRAPDRRADIFALGVVIHDLLTGGSLFRRSSLFETMTALVDAKVAPPSAVATDLDPALDPILLRALDADPERRYPTAAALGDALAEVLSRLPPTAPDGMRRYLDAHFADELAAHRAWLHEVTSKSGTSATPPGAFSDWNSAHADSPAIEPAPLDAAGEGVVPQRLVGQPPVPVVTRPLQQPVAGEHQSAMVAATDPPADETGRLPAARHPLWRRALTAATIAAVAIVFGYLLAVIAR